MKITNITITALLLLTFALCPVSQVYSTDLDTRTVGFDISEFEGFDGPGVLPPAVTDGDDNQSNESPTYDKDPEYDPNNPYAEWEN